VHAVIPPEAVHGCLEGPIRHFPHSHYPQGIYHFEVSEDQRVPLVPDDLPELDRIAEFFFYESPLQLC
jgi:hypothetical protein